MERFLKASFAILGGVLLAGAGSALVLSFPLPDPVDVVGVPLITGYSERAEQWAWYTLLAGSFLAAFLLERMVPTDCRWRSVLGAILLLAPGGLLAGVRRPMPTLAILAAVMVVYWASSRMRGATTGWMIGMGLVVGGLGFPNALQQAADPDNGVLIVAPWLLLTVVLWWFRWRREGAGTTGWVAAGTAYLAIAIPAAPWETLGIGALGALAYGMGSLGVRSDSPLVRPGWLAVAVGASAVLGFVDLRELGPWFAAGVVILAGGAAGWLLDLYARPMFPSANPAWQARLARLPAAWPAVLLLAMLPTRPLLALVGFAVAVLADRCEGRHRWLGFAIVLVLAQAVLLLSIPSHGTYESVHDGQIVSALWEFDSGRLLYSDVVPLRQFEFVVGWIGWRVWGESIGAYKLPMFLIVLLPVSGSAMLAFLWTRSLAWSLAACWCAALQDSLTARDGLILWLSAAAIGALPTRKPMPRLLIVLCVSALVGYDLFVPMAAACTLSMLFPDGRVGDRFISRATCTTFLLLATVAAITITIGTTQSFASAGAYWSLLIDYARNYPAFYGLPLPWRTPHLRTLLVFLALVGGLWSACLAFRWASLPPARRRSWCFLLSAFALFAHRGLGRSDLQHLGSLLPFAITLSVIGLFELIGGLRRAGLGQSFLHRRAIGQGLAALAALHYPFLDLSVDRLVHVVRAASLIPEPAPSESFLSRTPSPDGWLWDVEQGILNYQVRRHNPTRHALAYCMPSPAEQRRALIDLQRRPPDLIAWNFMSKTDNIANPLRYYVLSRWLFANYRPSASGYFLEPVIANTPGRAIIPPDLKGPLELGELALAWGRRRLPALRSATLESRSLSPPRPIAMGEIPPMIPEPAQAWEWDTPIDPRHWNYLVVTIVCRREPGRVGRGEDLTARWTFAPAGISFDEGSPITCRLRADDRSNTYVLPIGCSPAWSWRDRIDRLRLECPSGILADPPGFELWLVDEARIE